MILGSKGQTSILLGIVVIVILFIIMIVGFSVNNVVQDLNADFQDSNFNNESKEVMESRANNFPGLLDGIFLLALGIAVIGGLIGTYFIDEAPIWLVLDVLFFIFLLIGAAAMSNVYEEYAINDEFTGYENSFPVLNWVMNNLLIIIGGYVGIIITAMIIKQRTLI